MPRLKQQILFGGRTFPDVINLSKRTDLQSSVQPPGAEIWPSNPGNLNCRSFGHLNSQPKELRQSGHYFLLSNEQNTLIARLWRIMSFGMTHCVLWQKVTNVLWQPTVSKLQGRRHISPLPTHIDTECKSSISKTRYSITTARTSNIWYF